MNALQPLLGTTLVLAAHPDDEVILCGALMQKMKHATVVFATDGAPRDQGFWKLYGSRQAYATVRRCEVQRALAVIRAESIFLADRVPGEIADQELFRNLPPAIDAIEKIIAEVRPECILAPAYEGGHPDHDAACFIAADIARRLHVPAWESPLYHCRADGSHVVQNFPANNGSEIDLRVEPEALAKKIRMLGVYQSQNLVLAEFHPDRETFRPMVDYDFSQPPLPWQLNYERWGWKMTGREVSAAFAARLHGVQQGTL